MNRVVLGILGGLALVAAVAAAQQRNDTFGGRSMPTAPTAGAATGSELIVVPTTLAEKGQMLTVVDPRQRALCVYHIDLITGKIALKSARNIQWDLQVNNFNNEAPLPEEIQSLRR